MIDILFFIPNKKNKYTGIGKVGFHISRVLKENKNIIQEEVSINERNSRSSFQKFINLFQYFFIAIYNKKFKKTKVLFSTTSRLPIFGLNKKLYKIIFVHDLVYKRMPQTMSKFGLIADKFFVPNAIKRSELILCPSLATYQDIKKYFPVYIEKTNIVPLASSLTDAKNVSIKNLPFNNFILCVGTIEPRKNYINMLRGYAMLQKKYREKFPLIIVGNKGWGKINLDKEIISLGISNNVHIKSNQDDNYLKALFKNAYCLLYASLFEGFGLPIIEAHSLGVPVIVSNKSSMPEVAKDGALYVDPNSPNSIYDKLNKIIRDKNIRYELSKNAIKNAKNYSWQKVSDKIISKLCEENLLNLNL